MDSLDTSTLAVNVSTERVVLMPRLGYTIIAIIMATSCTLSVILNTTVIAVTIKYRQLRQPINYSLVNLAIADLGAALLGGTLNVETNAAGYYNLGRAGCVTEGFAMAFFGEYISKINLFHQRIIKEPLNCLPFLILKFLKVIVWEEDKQFQQDS